MAIVKDFHIVKVGLASFCCVNVIKYSMRPQQCDVFTVGRKLDFHSQNYLQNLLFA